MKKPIEKALGNGFKLPMTWDGRQRYDNFHVDEEGVSVTSTTGKFGGYTGFFELIFGTPFIDKLVGNRVMCTDDDEEIKECIGSECYSGWENCPDICEDSAKHHREQLSNMTLDEMKVYIRKLAQEGI